MEPECSPVTACRSKVGNLYISIATREVTDSSMFFDDTYTSRPTHLSSLLSLLFLDLTIKRDLIWA